jgi:hypothetical protein
MIFRTGLSPWRVQPNHVPLGPRPSLHRLRPRSPELLRQLHRYYAVVRLLPSVHHRLGLLTFPMRPHGVAPIGVHGRLGFPRFHRHTVKLA